MTSDSSIDIEEIYTLITSYATDLIAVLDADARYIFVSQSHEHILGFKPNLLLGKTLFDLFQEEDRLRAVEEWSRLMRDGIIRSTSRLQNTNGQWVWLEATGVVTASGKRVVSVSRDVTARVTLEGLQAQMHHAQQTRALGDLAGGVAHDFNNLLMVIMGAAEELSRQLGASSLNNDIRKILAATLHGTEIVQQLLNVAREQPLDITVVDLNKLISDTMTLIKTTTGEAIDLTMKLDPQLDNILADQAQMVQILLNLIVNARDAMPEGGKLTIETANILLDDSYAREHVGMTPGEYVQLVVSDTGVGMSAEVQTHIFEPFFTTKTQGKGTGLGLATCYRIIKQHGGHVWVYSEVGQGTTFKIYLPRAAQVEEELKRDDSTHSRPDGVETILVVEDVDDLREMLVRTLERCGYVVLEASNGIQAIQTVTEAAIPVHLLLTDVTMPKMGGTALAEQLIEMWPDMRIIFLSGWTKDIPPSKNARIVAKPISPHRLAQIVRGELDSISV